MELTLSLILQKLKPLHMDKKISFEAKFDKLRLLDLNRLSLDERVLYITNVRDFGIANNRIKDRTLIVSDYLSLMEKMEIAPGMNVIIVKDRISTEALINRLIILFESMEELEQDIRRNVFEGKDLWLSLDRLSEIFDIEINLLKDDFIPFNSSAKNVLPLSFNEKTKINDGVILGQLEEGKPYIVSSDSDKNDIIGCSYFFDNHWIHFLTKWYKGQAGKEEFFELLPLLKSCMKDALFSVQDQSQLLKQIVTRLLYGEDGQDLILNQLRKTNWKQDHVYQAFLFEQEKIQSPKELTDLEKIHKDSCTIRIGNQVLLVANLSLSPIQNKKLEKFIQNLEVKSAASNSFIGLEHLKEQYTSLVTFYQFISKRERISDYLQDYAEFIAALLKEKVPLLPLIDSKVMNLHIQDIEENTDNLETLYIYLRNERSYLKASKIMNLHRNSIVYRINRIQEIAGWDLDDEKMRAYIMFSYELLKYMENMGLYK